MASTENYCQHTIINHTENNCIYITELCYSLCIAEMKIVYICVIQLLCCTAQVNTL